MKCKNEKIFRQIKEILQQIKENIMKLYPYSFYLAFHSSQNLILFALLYLYIWFKYTYVPIQIQHLSTQHLNWSLFNNGSSYPVSFDF